MAVLQGSNVSFKANVTADWTIMTWNVGSLLVLTILRDSGTLPSSPRFVARNISTPGSTGGAWEFTIVNVHKSDSGPVVCTIQGTIGSKTATLQVQGTTTTNNNNNSNNSSSSSNNKSMLCL